MSKTARDWRIPMVARMRIQAERSTWDGAEYTPYFRMCRESDLESGTTIIFTRDVGMHDCGWFKNPDYNQCYHLSLSFYDTSRYPHGVTPRAPERGEAEGWVRLFYGDRCRYVWEESPVSERGKQIGVRHYRVMTDRNWQPIVPAGEVYTTAKTELGWKSWSDQQYAKQGRAA